MSIPIKPHQGGVVFGVNITVFQLLGVVRLLLTFIRVRILSKCNVNYRNENGYNCIYTGICFINHFSKITVLTKNIILTKSGTYLLNTVKQGNFTSILFPDFVSGQWAYLKQGKFFVSSVFEMKRITFRANFRSG